VSVVIRSCYEPVGMDPNSPANVDARNAMLHIPQRWPDLKAAAYLTQKDGTVWCVVGVLGYHELRATDGSLHRYLSIVGAYDGSHVYIRDTGVARLTYERAATADINSPPSNVEIQVAPDSY